MPELPEVEVVRRGLEQWVAGRTVASVEVHHPRAVRRHLEGVDHFVAALTGRTFTAAHRRGKYLWLPLAEADGTPAGQALVAHLGMSGQLLVEKPSQPDETHLRARFTFTDGGRELRFVDQRTFGGLAVEEAPDPDRPPPRLAHIAIDPLDPAFDVAALTRILEGSRQQIKGLLRDQSVLAGVGNAYSDEVLHAAKLSPYAVAGKLGEGEIERLWTAMRTVLTDAVEAAAGKPAKELKDAKRAGMRVHGRAGLPCPVCGDTVREVSFADRALQYCPTCQTGGKVLADRRLSRLLK